MSKMWLIGAGAALGALLVASIAVAVVRKPEALPDGTPGRAVQLYLEALSDDDYEAAHNLLSAELKRSCPIEAMVGRPYAKDELSKSRVTLKETTFVGGKAIVVAKVATIRGDGPFDTSTSEHEQRYTLDDEDGEWRFVSEPWPYGGCGAPRPSPRAPAPEATPPPPPGAEEGGSNSENSE